MAYLFACAIGPVQDFIATARRSRDLWFGSWMLSELSKAAALKLSQLPGGKLIFPSDEDTNALQPESTLNVSNKLLAIINGKPQEVAGRVHSAITSRLDTLKGNAFNQIDLADSCFDRVLAERQLEDLIEFYWSALPYQKEDDSYSAAREAVEALLSMRKNTRDFMQFNGKPLPKSSLDGNRESVIDERCYPQKNEKNENTRLNSIRSLYQVYHAKPGERLSGVDLLKRRGTPRNDSAPQFHSTSHFAGLPFHALLDAKFGAGTGDNLLIEIDKTLYKNSNWVVSDVPKDCALFYESRLSDTIPAGTEQNHLREELNKILIGKVGGKRPSPYYVLLHADGDNMGKTIDAQTNPADHRALSAILSNFSLEVKTIIENHEGGTIYAGGDDILAYLPLHHALDCAIDLENTFKLRILFPYIDPASSARVFPTLSVGLAIAHHLDPLAEVLELAREAEEKAKRVQGKNGFAVTLSRRSGVERTIMGKFQSTSSRLKQLIKYHQQNAVSKGTAYEFQQLYCELGGKKTLQNALEQEAIRILNRKRTSGNEEKVDDTIIKIFLQWMEEDKGDLRKLANEMIIANIFAQTYDMAANNEEG